MSPSKAPTTYNLTPSPSLPSPISPSTPSNEKAPSHPAIPLSRSTSAESKTNHAQEKQLRDPPTYPEVLTLQMDKEMRALQSDSSIMSPVLSVYDPMPMTMRAPTQHMAQPMYADAGKHAIDINGKEIGVGKERKRMYIYAWHKTRLGLRTASTVAMLLCLFLTIGFSNPDQCQRYLSCTWTVSMVTVAPALLAYNTLELLLTSLNTRGLHPTAHIPLDFIVLCGLIAGAAYDIIGGEYRQIKVVGIVEAFIAVLHAVLFGLDISATVRLSREGPRYLFA